MMDEFTRRLEQIARERGFKLNSRICPRCGKGLHVRVVPETNQTVLMCFNCGMHATIPIARDDGRRFDETYVPGVTGRPRPTATFKVKMNAAGRVVGVEKVR